MVWIHATNKIDPAKRDEFVKEFKAAGISELALKDPGCSRYHVYLPVDEDDVIMLLEEYEDMSNLPAHQQGEAFKKIMELGKKYGVQGSLEIMVGDIKKV